jgi:glycogen debranching enzyme
MIEKPPPTRAGGPPPTDPGELELPHATDPARLVMSRGNSFSVMSATGDVTPAGARELGLFHEDTRHLSHYELALPVGATTLLSSEAPCPYLSQIDLTASDRDGAGVLDEPSEFLHVRRKQLLDEELIDQIVFTNHLGHEIELEVELRFAADFADVFEVRGARRRERGRALPAVVGADQVELRYAGMDGVTYRTLLRFSPAPHRTAADRIVIRMALAPGEAQIQEVAVRPARGEKVDEPPLLPFDVRCARAGAETDSFREQCTRLRADDKLVQRGFERALGDVYALRLTHDGHAIVGAGIPWFAAPFGRDALITSAELLGFAPSLAGETLRFLARFQGQHEDPAREEEPGKILHELRRGEMAGAREIPHRPYYGSIDATPLFVVLAAETQRWLADDRLGDDLWPHVVSAMEWLERRTQGGTRFLAYQRVSPRGLDNQGWKDSREGVSFPDGRHARAPIALVEAQGYAIDAYRSAAYLATLRGEHEAANRWSARVDPFTRRLDEAFWVDETGYFALAIDAEGKQVPTLASNAGHLLWSRAVSPARARRVAEVLLSPELYSGWGIRTVGRGQTVFNPLSYHNGSVWPHDNALAALGMARYGLADAALRVQAGLHAAAEQVRDHRLPELFCGLGRGEPELLVRYPVSCSPQAWASGALFMLLQASLGLEPDAPAQKLTIKNPAIPRPLRRLDLHGMQVGAARVSLRFERSGRRTHCDVLDLRCGPLRVDIQIE